MAKKRKASCVCAEIRTVLVDAKVLKPGDASDKLVPNVKSLISSHLVLQKQLAASNKSAAHLKASLKEAVLAFDP